MMNGARIHMDKKMFVFVSILILIADITIVLDVPVLRQAFGFLVFSILPGFLLLQVLRLEKIGLLRTILFSIGLSIAFLMFFGLGINIIYPYVGISEPLATLPLMTTFSIVIMMLCIFVFLFRRKMDHSLISLLSNSISNISNVERILLILALVFPFISIVGTVFLNTVGNNLILMALLLVISIYVLLIALNPPSSELIYPISLLTISISILFMVSLRTSHLVGVDIHYEYFFFQLSRNKLHWDLSIFSHAYNTCLSVTVLPTIYFSLLRMSGEQIYKIIFPLIFSITSLGTYLIYKKYASNLIAFLATFFYMSQYSFIWSVTNVKFEIAILFFVLSVLLLFDEKIDALKRKLLFIIFGISIVVSHYSTVYIYVALLLLTWLLLRVFRAHDHRSNKKVTLGAIILFSITTFFWYAQATQVQFNDLTHYLVLTLRNLGEFFLMESRSSRTLALVGQEPSSASYLTQSIYFATGSIVKFFILIYLLYAIKSLKKTESKVSFDTMSLASTVPLFLAVAIPFFSYIYNLDRIYFQSIVILAQACPLGGMIIFKRLRPHLGTIIVSAILISQFLCQTGFVLQLSGSSTPIWLNDTGEGCDRYLVHDEDVACAKWLSSAIAHDISHAVYADRYSRLQLWSYGQIPYSKLFRSASHEQKIDEQNYGLIYLRYMNVVDHKLMEMNSEGQVVTRNMTDFSSRILNSKNKLYSNGGAEVYMGESFFLWYKEWLED